MNSYIDNNNTLKIDLHCYNFYIYQTFFKAGKYYTIDSLKFLLNLNLNIFIRASFGSYIPGFFFSSFIVLKSTQIKIFYFYLFQVLYITIIQFKLL
jgi:hypothetical protein